jgi:hypothetical protein
MFANIWSRRLSTQNSMTSPSRRSADDYPNLVRLRGVNLCLESIRYQSVRHGQVPVGLETADMV